MLMAATTTTSFSARKGRVHLFLGFRFLLLRCLLSFAARAVFIFSLGSSFVFLGCVYFFPRVVFQGDGRRRKQITTIHYANLLTSRRSHPSASTRGDSSPPAHATNVQGVLLHQCTTSQSSFSPDASNTSISRMEDVVRNAEDCKGLLRARGSDTPPHHSLRAHLRVAGSLTWFDSDATERRRTGPP